MTYHFIFCVYDSVPRKVLRQLLRLLKFHILKIQVANYAKKYQKLQFGYSDYLNNQISYGYSIGSFEAKCHWMQLYQICWWMMYDAVPELSGSFTVNDRIKELLDIFSLWRTWVNMSKYLEWNCFHSLIHSTFIAPKFTPIALAVIATCSYCGKK